MLAEARGDELAVAADRGEEVVEVVRDPAGEASDRLELLRLVQLLLERLALGDVSEHREVKAREHRGPCGQQDLDGRAVGADNGQLDLAPPGREELGPGVLVHALEDVVDPQREQLLEATAEQLAGGRVRVEIATVVAREHHPDRCAVEDRAEAPLLPANGPLGLTSGGDVRRHHDRAQMTAVLVQQRIAGQERIERRAVLPPERNLVLARGDRVVALVGELEQRAAEHLLWTPAEHVSELAVHECRPALGVE